MKILKRIFGQTEITWKLLIIYSVVTGVIVGLLNCVPALEKTSLVAPAVTFEYWFVAAIFVIVNCKDAKDAAIKTFVFFLISQPLIYLVEVPFKAMGWELFRYYPYWALITLFTLPGAWIAYRIKDDNILGAVILSFATGYLFFAGFGFAKKMIGCFPYGLIGVIFNLAFGVIFIQVILNKKSSRITAWICSIVFAVGLFFLLNLQGKTMYTGVLLDEGYQWEVVSSEITANIENNYLNLSASEYGTYSVILKNDKGETVEYKVEFAENHMDVHRPE